VSCRPADNLINSQKKCARSLHRCATQTAAEAIIETAKNKQCDLIVMSSHGRRGLARVLLGSQATRVLTLSSLPVLVCR